MAMALSSASWMMREFICVAMLSLAACAPVSSVSHEEASMAGLERAISWRSYFESACESRPLERCIEYWRNFDRGSATEFQLAKTSFEQRLHRSPNVALPSIDGKEVFLFVDPALPEHDEVSTAARQWILLLGGVVRDAESPCSNSCLNLLYAGGELSPPGSVTLVSESIVRPLAISPRLEPFFDVDHAEDFVPVMLSYSWSIGFVRVSGNTSTVYCALTLRVSDPLAQDELLACVAGGFRFPCSELCRGNQRLREPLSQIVHSLESARND